MRDKEDVPHEEALPDFYGLDDAEFPTIQEVKDELSAMVDAGELCMGWDAEQQAFTYWFPADEEEVWEDLAPEPTPTARRRKTFRPKGFRRAVLTVAATVAPLLLGMVAEASLDEHAQNRRPGLDHPDLAGGWAEEPTSAPTSASIAADIVTEPFEARPDGDNYARHARPTAATATHMASSYVGRHRKLSGASVPKKTDAKRPDAKRTDSTTAKTPSPAPAKKRTLPSPSPIGAAPEMPAGGARPKRENPVQEVVHNVLSPVESLLR
ncbi:hypothetical protein [Streptomyces sp. BK022]|uniref:hypothetical protein n=1 Tax=Streptomyces sp. BK022 TaxID=2512123 RepID=UPI0013EEFB07|nr:hypothetical protein [Streptomyces sp. BK022]